MGDMNRPVSLSKPQITPRTGPVYVGHGEKPWAGRALTQSELVAGRVQSDTTVSPKLHPRGEVHRAFKPDVDDRSR